MGFSTSKCDEFVEVLASKAPVPGGGGASALVAAVGTALGNMVGSLTVGKKKYADVEEEMYALKEKGLQAGQSDKSETASCGRSNGDICGYGAGYGARPYFEGGVGASCFWAILKKCGYSVTCHHSKHSNFYSVEKRGV